MNNVWNGARRLIVAAALLTATGCLGDPGINLPNIDVDLVSVRLGAVHACGLTPVGEPWCWGGNSAGQLGTGDFLEGLQPRQVFTAERFTELSLGSAFACGINGSGELWCWGTNSVGELGVGMASFPLAAPTKVPWTETFLTMSGGGGHTCGIQSNSKLYCWGTENSGQLGNDRQIQGEFTAFPDSVYSDSTFIAVATGGEHTCALTPSGVAFCWGRGDNGQLGDSLRTLSPVPVAVAGGLTFTALSAGGNHTCGIVPGGDLYCWGGNQFGQLGVGSGPVRADAPTQIAAGTTWLQVNAGGVHTCALASDNQAFCWGNNDSGQLGNGSQAFEFTPTAVVTTLRFASIHSGAGLTDTATCAMTTTGLAYCWGGGKFGQLGSGDITEFELAPVVVRGQVSN